MADNQLVLEATELLPERLASTLRRAIVEGKLPAGVRLIESDLVRQFGVSRVPLREAFRVLEGEGLVTIHPHRGAMVNELSDQELIELFAVRAMLEAYATESVAVIRDEGVILELELAVAQMRQAMRAKDLGRYYALAADFHVTIVHRCGNSILIRQYDQIKCLLSRYQAAMMSVADLPAKSIVEHEQMIRAIRAGDTSGAAKMARSHVEDLVVRYQASRKKAAVKKAPSRKSRASA